MYRIMNAFFYFKAIIFISMYSCLTLCQSIYLLKQ